MRNAPLLLIAGLGGVTVSMTTGWLVADYATAGIAAPYSSSSVGAHALSDTADTDLAETLPPLPRAGGAGGAPVGDDGFDDPLLASR